MYSNYLGSLGCTKRGCWARACWQDERFGILKLLTLHWIKMEDKDQQVPKGKTQKKEGGKKA